MHGLRGLPVDLPSPCHHHHQQALLHSMPCHHNMLHVELMACREPQLWACCSALPQC